ncbi:potassium-transporting ATPase subunit F [Leucobacter chromiireducens]|uniref:Potassium-transporting ATPase subunit F n=1 Tax=Leucobacter chromiireducens subsp. solipictus TaxID=398235 RepID=A0ABS1SJH5_9MICO|nr:potassium-transporting ATPase subunit F [Leucobacter chromiireducens subsp. solipictus]
MIILEALAALLGLGAIAYLVCALVKPERF